MLATVFSPRGLRVAVPLMVLVGSLVEHFGRVRETDTFERLAEIEERLQAIEEQLRSPDQQEPPMTVQMVRRSIGP